MSNVLGIAGVNLPCQSWEDWHNAQVFISDIGLNLGFCENNSTLQPTVPGSKLELHWFVEGEFENTIDPSGIKHFFYQLQPVPVDSVACMTNTCANKERVNKRVASHPNVQPIKVAHIALYVTDLAESISFYEQLGFTISDSIRDRCVFLRCSPIGDHHDILLVKADQAGLHHVSLEMRDIYSVFSKGIEMDKRGWSTRLGPGRHPISSATFWYFDSPFGLVEVAADHDFVTEDWEPEIFEPSIETATEWAVDGGINHKTRRQNGATLQGVFVDQHSNRS